ncbi:MAG: TerD family protein [Nakamurella sp.]
MTTELSKGGNTPWPHPNALLQVTGLPTAASVLAFLVTEAGKVRTDDDFVFFNNPAVPGVTVREHTADIDLGQIPNEIARIVIAAVQDDADPAPLSVRPLQVLVEPMGLEIAVTGLSTERAVVLVEVYRRAGQWKLRNVSAGWSEGFPALVRAHGIDVEEDNAAAPVPSQPEPVLSPPAEVVRAPEPVVSPPQPAAAGPTLNLRKPGVDAIDLGKRTGTINLRKGQQVTITKTHKVVATCTWPRDTDYDIFALVRYRDGHCETVATFGTEDAGTDFQLVTKDGAVRHAGDVGRAKGGGWRKKQALGKETIEINLTPAILAVVPVIYSAQSNGLGSFRKYQVSMAIDNGSGDTVTIDASDASDDEMVFSCVPGIIINDADGVRILFLELYSAPENEQRPGLGADLIVTMDVGPFNAFK